MEPRIRLSPGGLARWIVFMSQQQAPADFGHADPDGIIYVRVGDAGGSVGQIPDSAPEEALAFYTRRYEDLAVEVTLFVFRMETQTIFPEEARRTIGTTRTNVMKANAVGDLAALTTRLDALEELLPVQIEACKAAHTEQNANTTATKHAMVSEAKALTSRNDWRRGVGRLRELFEEWKTLPRVDRTTDNELRHRSSSARTQYMRHRKAHFSKLNARRDETKRLEEQIIAEAAPLVEPTD